MPLITFDLGGVIVRLSRYLEEAATVAGVSLRPAHPTHNPELPPVFDQWQRGQISDPEFFQRWAAGSGRFDVDDAPRLSLGWLAGEYEGVASLIAELRASGVTTGCLSNTCAHHWAHMTTRRDLFPAIAMLEHQHGSHLLGEMKPDPDIYRTYERLTGRNPQDIVFFDDLEANIQGARDCGWNAIRVMPDREPARQMRETLAELGLLGAGATTP
mgnify:CR=1 FL=1